MKLPGGLNNMLMHLAQLQVDYGSIPTNCIYLNNGDQFGVHANSKMHAIQDIFTWKTYDVERCHKYKLLKINANWYGNKQYNNQLNTIYKHLKLAPRLLQYAKKIHTVVHMRLEHDWVHIARMCIRRPRHCWWPREVFQKVNDSSASVVIAQHNTDKQTIKNIKKFFTIIPNHPELSYTENTAVHMAIAANANYFWGNSFSTFSRGVAQMRQVRNKTSFAYDCAKNELSLNSFHLKSHGLNAFIFKC